MPGKGGRTRSSRIASKVMKVDASKVKLVLDNEMSKVNKRTRARSKSVDEDQERKFRNDNLNKKPKKCSASVAKHSENESTKARFMDESQDMEMEVDQHEQEYVFPHSEIVETEAESSSHEEEDENNNVTISDDNQNDNDDQVEFFSEEEGELIDPSSQSQSSAKSSGHVKGYKRKSMEEYESLEKQQEVIFGHAMTKMQKRMEEMLENTVQKLQEQLQSCQYGQREKGERIPVQVDSKITIYKNAVKDDRNKINRGSSSSEDWVDTSDENINEDNVPVMDQLSEFKDLRAYDMNEEYQQADPITEHQINDFIADQRWGSEENVEPSTSGWKQPRDQSQHRQQIQTADDCVNELIREAEAAKAKIYNPGKVMRGQQIDLSRSFVHSAMVDENYLIVAAHVDEHTQVKIEKGQYVDLARLIPRDRLDEEDDNTMQMVVKQGKTFWKPSSLYEGVTINNIAKWEQAFRVFADIYTRAHPHRATELIQYNHIIHMTASTYVWDNVYLYDKDFCIHMSNYPERNWGIILQQA